MREQTAGQLRSLMREEMRAEYGEKKDRAEAALRRGILFLCRDVLITSGSFAQLAFIHEVTRPEYRTNPRLGVEAMERLGGERLTVAQMEQAASDVPRHWYAIASDAFFDAAEWMGESGEVDPLTQDGAEEGVRLDTARESRRVA